MLHYCGQRLADSGFSCVVSVMCLSHGYWLSLLRWLECISHRRKRLTWTL